MIERVVPCKMIRSQKAESEKRWKRKRIRIRIFSEDLQPLGLHHHGFRLVSLLYERKVANMLTKYITSVSAVFSPFNARSGKTARNFLALLPPNARSSMAIDVQMMGRNGSTQPASLALKFSMCSYYRSKTLGCRIADESCNQRMEKK